jgi:hypothetical protein
LADTMTAIASQSGPLSDWPSTTKPVSAANAGWMLLNTP